MFPDKNLSSIMCTILTLYYTQDLTVHCKLHSTSYSDNTSNRSKELYFPCFFFRTQYCILYWTLYCEHHTLHKCCKFVINWLILWILVSYLLYVYKLVNTPYGVVYWALHCRQPICQGNQIMSTLKYLIQCTHCGLHKVNCTL